MNKSIAISLLCCGILVAGCQAPELNTYSMVQTFDLRDSDQDGVINSRDICADSPVDSVIDELGCAEWQYAEKTTDFVINFEFDSAKLQPSEFETIIKVKVLVDKNDSARIYLVGDTSPEGSDEYNAELGKKRADAIVAQLLYQGVPEQRIEEYVYNETSVRQLLKKRERRTIIRVVHNQHERIQPWSIYSTENQRGE